MICFQTCHGCRDVETLSKSLVGLKVTNICRRARAFQPATTCLRPSQPPTTGQSLRFSRSPGLNTLNSTACEATVAHLCSLSANPTLSTSSTDIPPSTPILVSDDHHPYHDTVDPLISTQAEVLAHHRTQDWYPGSLPPLSDALASPDGPASLLAFPPPSLSRPSNGSWALRQRNVD